MCYYIYNLYIIKAFDSLSFTHIHKYNGMLASMVMHMLSQMAWTEFYTTTRWKPELPFKLAIL